MRPIPHPRDLEPGTTLYHSAFGFAHVREVNAEGVGLVWERQGAHLPAQVGFDNLTRVYALCAPDGFFHRALTRPEVLARVLHERPADALAWLLDDLDAPQRLRDVMDWLVGRELFTPKTFVRWWGTAEAAIKADNRLSLDGEWLHRRTEPPAPITQLEPGAVLPEAELDLDVPASVLAQAAPDPSLDGEPVLAPYQPMQAVPLSDAQPPPSSLADIGLAMAEALATAHGQGTLVHPVAAHTVLHPDGRVTFLPGQASAAVRAEMPSPGADVREAAIVLIEAFTGRHVPSVAHVADLLPHLRHRLPQLPPSAMAPLFSALRAHPDHRPTASAWAAQWAAVRTAEAARASSFVAGAMLRCGYDTHVGRVKLLLTQTNQDALWVGTRGAHGLFALADGISISDAGRGDLASWLTVQALSRLWQAAPIDRVNQKALLDRGLHLANRAICQHALRAAGGDLTGRMPMGTTATVAITAGNRVHLSWLGDSRAYLIGPYGVSLLTADDNVSGERFSSWCDGTLRAWNADGHALVRYLGHFDERQQPAPFPAHHTSFVLQADERLVICSDGVTDYLDVHEAEIAHQLHTLAVTDDLDDACRKTIMQANRMGGGDNITMLIIEVDDPVDDLW